MKQKRFFWCFVMGLVAIGFGLLVTLVAQDTQDLQNQERRLKIEISKDAERIKVLQAEWAYLTRPEYLTKIVTYSDKLATWKTIKGNDMVALSDLLASQASQIALMDQKNAETTSLEGESAAILAQ